jgi:proline iminopeptidase
MTNAPGLQGGQESLRNTAGGKPLSRCSREGALFDGGTTLIMNDGATVWYKSGGYDNAKMPLYFFHGGPGYNSFAFEKAVGAELDKNFRVVYIDQRGTGRSSSGVTPGMLGMAKTVLDIERVRDRLGHARIALVAHSFGGVVAAEYARRYPERVLGLAFVESTPFLDGSIGHQIAELDANAETLAPGQSVMLHTLLGATERPLIDRLMSAYSVLGRQPLQRFLDFASDTAQQNHEAFESASGLSACPLRGVTDAFAREGYFDGTAKTHILPMPAPSVLIVGRKSRVLGEENVTRGAGAWNSRVVWFEESGHFPYLEEPALFVRTLQSAFVGLR